MFVFVCTVAGFVLYLAIIGLSFQEIVYFLMKFNASLASSSFLKVTYQLSCSAYSQWIGVLGHFSLLNIFLTELSETFDSISLKIRIERLFAGG